MQQQARCEAASSDEELMRAFQLGRAEAFARLVGRHRRGVFNFILRFTGEPQRAEDLLQETWLKVVRSAPEYRPTARFSTWLYSIARNQCIDHARKERSRHCQSLDAPVEGSDSASTLAESLADGRAAVDPEQVAHHARVRPLLERALGQLPLVQREVFLLRELQGAAFKEIAEATGTKEPTVKSRMRYALETLRRSMEELGVVA